ncbi:integrase [Chryseobacterium nematophagum]|uniref:Integrase n=1 Tax=Chryseobacterium nematophagum TaxID=2305228 RepID=A0A3M7TJL2_9FLAO|nr:tyrosine-type recombinase/integrase [Chryseobacterium nematophagum]RNA63751.1 integrase [Chryseobacterium nematophagum]
MTFEFFISNTPSSNIYLAITPEFNSECYYGRERFVLRTALKITPEQWDKDKQRPINIYLKKNKKINMKLDKLKIELTEYIKKNQHTRKAISQRALSFEVKKICSSNIEYPQFSLLYFVQLYIESKKDIISHSTYKRYKVFLHLIEKFEGYIKERLYINNLNENFIKNFILFGKEETYSENTIYRTIHFIRTILNFAERKGIKTTIREIEIKKEKQKREIVILTEKEIIEIQKIDLPKDLQPARDWLLISCYTGQRISDFMEFSIDKIIDINGKSFITFTQKKTKRDILLPLHPYVLSVLKNNGNNFPKKLNQSAYNANIKKIAFLAKLKEPVKTRKREGHRARNILVEKWEAISSHIGRRSFATMFYGKIPTPLLMEATGHSTEQMFLKYINPGKENRALYLSEYFDNIYQKKLMHNI